MFGAAHRRLAARALPGSPTGAKVMGYMAAPQSRSMAGGQELHARRRDGSEVSGGYRPQPGGARSGSAVSSPPCATPASGCAHDPPVAESELRVRSS